MNKHTSYPISLHASLPLPWNYASKNEGFFLQSNPDQACSQCKDILKNTYFQGIMQRLTYGICESTPLMYYPTIHGLKLIKLNDTRKLVRKMVTIDDHKEWVMLVASGRVDRVTALSQVVLKNKGSIRTLIAQYGRAVDKLYSPKSYTRAEIDKAIIFLHLGGVRVGNFAHRSSGLPSVTTAHRNSNMKPLTISICYPTVKEIEANIDACSEIISEEEECGEERIVHVNLMLDKIKLEKRPRWDDRTNMIVGVCREHSWDAPLEFCNEKDLDLLCEKLEQEKVHLAEEATVGAISLLTDNPREYSARPILISGTCKRENAEQHARLLQTSITALKNCKQRGNTTYRLQLPIYPLLSNLPLLNLRVGEDDLTCGKDHPHLEKRARTALLRKKGVQIQGYTTTAPTIRAHLASNGVNSARINALTNPKDKQDVVLAYSLISAIIDLPEVTDSSNPGFIRARKALRTYADFAHNLLFPFICVDLNLEDQLIMLSAATHLALFLYTDWNARTKFIPNQSYIDIQITVKNVYFCVAKCKVDCPGGKCYIISLGTDRLEGLFGLTEVDAIRAEHPEWDKGARRLHLPQISRNSVGELSSKFDHINPRSWRGDVSVVNVNLQTCWEMGRKKAVKCIPESGLVFENLVSDPNIDMFAPFGESLVNYRDAEEEDEEDEGVPVEDEPQDRTSPQDCTFQTEPFVVEGDIEDAIAEEMAPESRVSSSITIAGEITTKPKALRRRFMDRFLRSSTDRLKQIANVSCFLSSDQVKDQILCDSDSLLGPPALCIGHPIVTVVRCAEDVFLAVAEVIGITYMSNNNVQGLNLELLGSDNTKISYQILRLIPATVQDDPTEEHDWIWKQTMELCCTDVPGRLIHAFNPDLAIIPESAQAVYLFDSATLVTTAAQLKKIPILKEKRALLVTIVILAARLATIVIPQQNPTIMVQLRTSVLSVDLSAQLMVITINELLNTWEHIFFLIHSSKLLMSRVDSVLGPALYVRSSSKNRQVPHEDIQLIILEPIV
ncbi:hypothetical protein K435DRAFT_821336 [Dendrothele bispora CBS 962.96]|uniref:Uncharacterized protein n=1 Tax=Dendrothele bispora (strain CBS 962.96) TaxID=1314807 RepID=A0A4S8LKC1_DENBC|nr:hypothetical protein K435DRAFT_821336 [Dendrothele bispora CBS 962.96]